MKSNLKLPHLKWAGISKRFLIFIEIARHPTGLSLPDITAKFGGTPGAKKEGKKKKITSWYHVNELRARGLITTEYENRNGSIVTICKATPTGTKDVHDEMCRLCSLLKTTVE